MSGRPDGFQIDVTYVLMPHAAFQYLSRARTVVDRGRAGGNAFNNNTSYEKFNQMGCSSTI